MSFLFICLGADKSSPRPGRCVDDHITTPAQGAGRNAWARKCGYLSADDEASNNLRQRYAVFHESNAPDSASAPCVDGLTYLADCLIGCFEASQELLFEEGLVPVSRALEQDLSALVTLAAGSKSHDLRWSLEPVESYTVGNFDGELIQILADDGSTVAVTPNHPMFMEDGEVRSADRIYPGDVLLGASGDKVVSRVVSLPYQGKVYNVRPDSDDLLANTNVAEGFVTGSIRFQNEWANEDFRLALRNRLQAPEL